MNEPQHTVAFVCSHVFDATRPVLLVAREGGDWQLLCGSDHGESERPHVVGLEHLLKRDSTLEAVLDLPDNWEAERPSVGAMWERRQCDPTDYE
jgi:hypothetical protein